MTTTKQSLREMALAPSLAFRTKIIPVPEWKMDVTVREPSGDAWVKFREFLTPPEPKEGEEPAKLTVSQEFMRNKDADVILFIDVLVDEAGDHVFSEDDTEIVREIYGPVHKRLLSAALALGVDQGQAEKK